MVEDGQYPIHPDRSLHPAISYEVVVLNLEGTEDSTGDRIVSLELWLRGMPPTSPPIRLFLRLKLAWDLKKALQDLEWWNSLP